MLDLMRRQSYLIYVVFGGIIFIFAINFGPGSTGCSHAGTTTADWAAKVDGEAVRRREFEMVYSRQLSYLRQLAQRSGQGFDDAMAARMGLPKQVLDSLVERKLLAKEAAARGLYVSDAELAEFLAEQYGVKDVSMRQYEDWVKGTFLTNVERFEEEARADIAASRVAKLVTELVEVGDEELKQDYTRDHDRVMLHFVRFDVDPQAAPEPKAADVDKLLATDMTAVERQYQKDTLAYRTPPQVHVSQIVQTVAPGASDTEVTTARDALMGIAKKLAQGGDFAALAKESSQDRASAAGGGDLGWIDRGQLAKPLEDAAFNLQAGAWTPEPVRSPQGWHLLRVTEKREAQRRDLAEVKRDVAVALLREQTAEAMAKSQAESLLAALRAGKKWDGLTVDEDLASTTEVKAARLLRRDTPWVTRSQPAIPRIGLAKEMHDDAFALTEAKPIPERTYKVGSSYYVMGLKARETPDLERFAAEREALRKEALSTKRNRVLHDWLAYLRNQSKVQMNASLLGGSDAG